MSEIQETSGEDAVKMQQALVMRMARELKQARSKQEIAERRQLAAEASHSARGTAPEKVQRMCLCDSC